MNVGWCRIKWPGDKVLPERLEAEAWSRFSGSDEKKVWERGTEREGLESPDYFEQPHPFCPTTSGRLLPVSPFLASSSIPLAFPCIRDIVLVCDYLTLLASFLDRWFASSSWVVVKGCERSGGCFGFLSCK